MSVARLTEIEEKGLSFSGDAKIITTYKDNFTTSGKAFLFEKNFAIADDGSLYILIDYTTYSGDNVFILPPQFGATDGAVVVNVYRGTDYTGGTEFDAINPNTTVAKTTSATTLTYGATGTTKGTEVLNYLVGASSTPLFSGGGGASGASFFIRQTTSKTLVEVVNNSGSDIIFHYGQVLFEI